MKKITALFMVLTLGFSVLCFGGCAGGEKETAPGGQYVFSLSADKTEVSPGEQVTVTLHMAQCENVACFDVVMTADEKAAVAGYDEKDVGELYTQAAETEDGIRFGGYVAETCDIADADYCYVTYTVSDEAVSGDTLTFSAYAIQFLIGTDDSGAETKDITDRFMVEPVVITVK